MKHWIQAFPPSGGGSRVDVVLKRDATRLRTLTDVGFSSGIGEKGGASSIVSSFDASLLGSLWRLVDFRADRRWPALSRRSSIIRAVSQIRCRGNADGGHLSHGEVAL